MKINKTSLSITEADYNNPAHIFHIISLINEYRCDTMGGNIGKLSETDEEKLITCFKNHPSSLVYFVFYEKVIIVGMAVCFIGFSTFKAQYLLNIHDIIVYKEFRDNGAGTFLLEKISEDAKCKGYCKLTLEVRMDNQMAKKLYTKSGFKPCDDPMEFWIKGL